MPVSARVAIVREADCETPVPVGDAFAGPELSIAMGVGGDMEAVSAADVMLAELALLDDVICKSISDVISSA